MRYAIGDFSRISKLSIKALRLYHEEGILIPSAVDRESGYRYYDERSLEQAKVITRLRELDFSLKEIGEILGFFSDDSQLVSHLQKKIEQVEEKMTRYGRIREVLASIVSQEEEYASLQGSADVAVKELPDLLVAGLRFRGRYQEVGKKLETLGRTVGRRFKGPVFSLYYDGEFQEEGADIEACIGVRRPVSGGEVASRVLPGGRAATLRHHGPYDSISLSYKKIIDYVSAKRLAILLPSREVYLKGPGVIFSGNPKKFITEIQVLLAPRGGEEVSEKK